jgi:hypothetical protein
MIAEKNKYKLLWVVSSLFVVVFLVRWWQNDYNKILLEKGVRNTPAVIIRISEGAVSVPAYGVFRFSVDGKIVGFRESGNYLDFNSGDTVLIEYAIADHSVARVVDKYYMKKYAYLKKIEQ